MKTRAGKARTPVLVLWLTLWLTAASPIHALENWSVDMARMLMADPWDLDEPQQTAVVGYVIHLVEVDRRLVKALSVQLELTSEESPGVWLVTGRDLDLGVRAGGSLAWSAQSQVWWDKRQQMTSYDSWLLTVDGQPARANVSMARVPTEVLQPKEERIEVTILPLRAQDGRIESHIQITFEDFEGTAAQVATTHWVGPEAEHPLAVVARRSNTNKKGEYQYFALYLAGTLIPSTSVPAEAPVLPMGSISGLAQFIDAPPEKRWVDVGVSVARREGEWGWQLEGSVPLGDRYRIYGHAGPLSNPAYLVGAEGSLNGELCFVAEALMSSDERPMLRFGVRDVVYLGEHLRLSATLVPMAVDFPSWKPSFVLDWQIRADFLQPKYTIWYQIDRTQRQFIQSIGTSIWPTDTVGAKVSWIWDGHNSSVFLLGLQVRF